MASSQKKEETDLFDLLKELAKNWHIMLPCIILAGAVGVFVAMWIRPVYQVDSLLQIESKNSKGAGLMAGLGSLFASTSPAETEIELIKSRQVIGDAVDKLHLQYSAIPTSKINRLLHREGRMDINQLEIPWQNVPKEEKRGRWTAVAMDDSVHFALFDHNKKKVLEGEVGHTYHFPYAGDTAIFSVYKMNAMNKVPQS